MTDPVDYEWYYFCLPYNQYGALFLGGNPGKCKLVDHPQYALWVIHSTLSLSVSLDCRQHGLAGVVIACYGDRFYKHIEEFYTTLEAKGRENICY